MPATNAAAFPYATHLDVKFDPVRLVDVPSLVEALHRPMVQSDALQSE